MRIQISGFAGAGKSTLAKKLGEFYNINILHIDSLHFEPNWIIRDDEKMEADVKKFLEENNDWVIDGNYYRHNIERYELADKIIYLDYNRFVCFFRSLKRANKNRNSQRLDMAPGCLDKPSLSFSLWVLFGSRKKKITNRFKAIQEKYPDKVIVLRNDKELENYLKVLRNEYKRANWRA